MPQNPELLSLLRDIEMGPADRKRTALGKLCGMPEVPLTVIQPPVDKVFERAPDGSAVKFFAASNLAARGDRRPEVTNVLMPYMAQELLVDDGKPIAFPWLTASAKLLGNASSQDENNLLMAMPELLERLHSDPWANKPGYAWQHSVQLATLEAISYLRHDERVSDTLIEALESLSAPIWRALFLYTLASLGNPKSRRTLEYYSNQYSKSSEGRAARLALEHFGDKTFMEFVQLHQTSVQKSGCFIATAVYGSYGAHELEWFYLLRNDYLMKHGIGRLFVSLYYSVSPVVARLVTKSPTARRFLGSFLLTPLAGLIKSRIASNRYKE